MLTQNLLMDKQRELVGVLLLTEIVSTIRIAVLKKAIQEMKAGRWDDLKQLRLDGVLHICKKATLKNIDLRILSWIAYQNNFRIDFQLASLFDDNMVFTDTGRKNLLEEGNDDDEMLEYYKAVPQRNTRKSESLASRLSRNVAMGREWKTVQLEFRPCN